MSTLDQLRDGLSKAWETVTEGWRELVDRAGDALTRFQPKAISAKGASREEQIAQQGTRWGVLAAEVQLDDNEVEISVEVPGMAPDDFKIDVVDNVLVIRGEKRVQRTREHGEYHVMERAYGSFERAVRLPVPVDDTKAKASYRHGVLNITLPKKESHRARRITVVPG